MDELPSIQNETGAVMGLVQSWGWFTQAIFLDFLYLPLNQAVIKINIHAQQWFTVAPK
jgi:hypothetical protein